MFKYIYHVNNKITRYQTEKVSNCLLRVCTAMINIYMTEQKATLYNIERPLKIMR